MRGVTRTTPRDRRSTDRRAMDDAASRSRIWPRLRTIFAPLGYGSAHRLVEKAQRGAAVVWWRTGLRSSRGAGIRRSRPSRKGAIRRPLRKGERF